MTDSSKNMPSLEEKDHKEKKVPPAVSLFFRIPALMMTSTLAFQSSMMTLGIKTAEAINLNSSSDNEGGPQSLIGKVLAARAKFAIRNGEYLQTNLPSFLKMDPE